MTMHIPNRCQETATSDNNRNPLNPLDLLHNNCFDHNSMLLVNKRWLWQCGNEESTPNVATHFMLTHMSQLKQCHQVATYLNVASAKAGTCRHEGRFLVGRTKLLDIRRKYLNSTQQRSPLNVFSSFTFEERTQYSLKNRALTPSWPSGAIPKRDGVGLGSRRLWERISLFCLFVCLFVTWCHMLKHSHLS